MDELVYRKANSIYKVLNEYFTPLYLKEVPVPLLPPSGNLYPQLSASQPSIQRAEPFNMQFPIISYLSAPAPIIINNNPQPIIIREQSSLIREGTKKKEEYEEKKKEEDNTGKQIAGGLALAGISLAGTYLIAKDGYVNFLLSDVETCVNGLMELKDNSVRKNDMLAFQYDYDVWKSFYLKRTKKTFAGKVGGISSGLLMAGALIASSGFGLVVGGALAVGSGCYLLWNKLTAKTMTEEEAYDAMMTSLFKLSGPEIHTNPTAPPMDVPQQLPMLPPLVQSIGPGSYQPDFQQMNTEVYHNIYQQPVQPVQPVTNVYQADYQQNNPFKGYS